MIEQRLLICHSPQYAASCMNGEMVKFLLEWDIDPNETSDSGM
jgi:hypothetical protein